MSMNVKPSDLVVGAVPLPQWDKTIAPILQRVEGHAWVIAREATYIASVMAILELKPDWLTKAGAGLDDAIQTTRNALTKLESARAAYQAKPVMADAVG